MAQAGAAQARALSADDISGLREVLSGGGTPTVWFTSSAVGVEQGRSGKVVALGDQADGDFVQVRPAGSKDVLSFSAAEVTVVKPERKRKESTNGSTNKAGDVAPKSVPSELKPSESSQDAAGVDAKPKPQATKAATSQASAPKSDARRKPRQSGGQPGGVITLTAGADGQWSVEVNNGKKRVLRPTSVPASAVAHAARALHDDVAHAVEPLLEAARQQQRDRVEQLERELSEAQRALADLTE